jgi:hypothetical protein
MNTHNPLPPRMQGFIKILLKTQTRTSKTRRIEQNKPVLIILKKTSGTNIKSHLKTTDNPIILLLQN